jgi:hexokinase
MPNQLQDEIKTLEEMFTVETPKLKEITAHFVSELKKGTGPATNPVFGLVAVNTC